MSETDEIELIAETLTGDITTWLIDRLRNFECAYRYMPETEQREAIQSASTAAHRLVVAAVRTIASKGSDAIPVQVKKVVNTGAEVQVTLETSKTNQHRHALFDAAGASAVLVVADPSDFEGGAEPQPDPDQPSLDNVA